MCYNKQKSVNKIWSKTVKGSIGYSVVGTSGLFALLTFVSPSEQAKIISLFDETLKYALSTNNPNKSATTNHEQLAFLASTTKITYKIQDGQINADTILSSINTIAEKIDKGKRFYNNLKNHIYRPAVIEKEPDAPNGNWIYVNLTTKKAELRVGTATLETLDIVSIGKPGSYYETPGGMYTSSYKAENHYSSFGNVWMPYSVQIFGNFFIHGIPYNNNGERVSSSYSGGCIRLEDGDAKKIFDHVTNGTQIYITRDRTLNSPLILNADAVSKITSDIYVIYDLTNGDIIASKNENSPVTSDSLRKYLTASVSLEMQAQDKAVPPPSYKELETTTRREELSSLINQGNGEIIKWFAAPVGEKTFVSWMNQKSKALGMTDTVINEINSMPLTTARDEAMLLAHLYVFKSYLLGERFNPKDSELNKSFSVEKVNINNQFFDVGIVMHNSADIESDINSVLNGLSLQ